MTDNSIIRRLESMRSDIVTLSIEIASCSERPFTSKSVSASLYYSNLEQLLDRTDKVIEQILDKHKDLL